MSTSVLAEFASRFANFDINPPESQSSEISLIS